MRYVLLCPLFMIAACATSNTTDLKRMSIAEACYLGMIEPDRQQAVLEEVRRRNDDCSKHSDEIAKIRDLEMRAGGNPGGTSPGESGSGAQRSGGMGRGY